MEPSSKCHVLPITTVDNGATEWSTSGSLGDVSQIRKPLFRSYTGCATPPHIHPMSWYVPVCDKFYQSFPYISTASERPGYEASQALPPCVLTSLLRHCYMILYPCSCFDNYISTSCVADTGLNAYVPVWGLKWLAKWISSGGWRDSKVTACMHVAVSTWAQFTNAWVNWNV